MPVLRLLNVIGKPPSQPGLFAPLAAYSTILRFSSSTFAHSIILFSPLDFPSNQAPESHALEFFCSCHRFAPSGPHMSRSFPSSVNSFGPHDSRQLAAPRCTPEIQRDPSASDSTIGNLMRIYINLDGVRSN